jgi:hypothetical protein
VIRAAEILLRLVRHMRPEGAISQAAEDLLHPDDDKRYYRGCEERVRDYPVAVLRATRPEFSSRRSVIARNGRNSAPSEA